MNLDLRMPLVWLVALCAAPAVAPAPDTSAPPGKLVLPEPITATALAQALREPASDLLVLDLRPAWQATEWTLAGARHVEVDAVADLLATVPATQRVVLVDRDGTLAFAVAGALLVHHPERPLRALTGGLQHYHRTVVLGGSGDAPPMAPAGQPAPATSPAIKKRSAGC